MADNRFHIKSGEYKLSELSTLVGGSVEGDEKDKDVIIKDVASIKSAKQGDIVFFNDKKKQKELETSKASACIVSNELKSLVPNNLAVIVCENTKKAFALILTKFYPRDVGNGEISASAYVAKTAKLGKNVQIGQNAVIEEDVEIGDGSIIGHNSVISRGVVLGKNCIISNNVNISNSIVGNKVLVLSGTKIGQDGFGYVMGSEGHFKIPQIGRVIIEDDVEIGSNSTIDRGALDDTVIGTGCRIDNLVQIGHNVKLGKGCIIVSQVGISGSCTFGDFVVAGGQAGFADHLTINSGAMVGAQAGVIKDVPPMEKVMGMPASPAKEFMRGVATLKKLTKNKNKK